MDLLPYETRISQLGQYDFPYIRLYRCVGAFVHDSSGVHCSEACDGILSGAGNLVIKSWGNFISPCTMFMCMTSSELWGCWPIGLSDMEKDLILNVITFNFVYKFHGWVSVSPLFITIPTCFDRFWVIIGDRTCVLVELSKQQYIKYCFIFC
jgi:hypothetical protein